MTSEIIRTYLTQDMTPHELSSYVDYINGHEESIDWIEKADSRRDQILLLDLKCQKMLNGRYCNSWVNINETGVCECRRGHDCYDVVIQVINTVEQL